MKFFDHNTDFKLENGTILPAIRIAYDVYGELNAAKDNVVWVCHALTASSDAADWWKGLVGDGSLIDPSKYFIVCANMLGSCYGSTGPTSINPATGEIYYSDFPQVTIRDIVASNILLRKHLNIDKIH